uniref:protein RD3 n=1 Tax=Myxine glutinosa TaxID=7769 RepID=UPI00358E479F
MWLRSMAGATRSHQRPLEPCTTMLMAELVAQIREASRQAWRRSRALCLQAPPGCADYTWLISPAQAPPAFDISSGVCLELEDLCGQLRPRDCGPAILRFRELIESREPEPSEVPMLFRSTLREFAVYPPRPARAHDGGRWAGPAPRRTHSLLWNLVPAGRSIGWFSTARIRPTTAVSTISADVEWDLPDPSVRTESVPNVQFTHEDVDSMCDALSKPTSGMG